MVTEPRQEHRTRTLVGGRVSEVEDGNLSTELCPSKTGEGEGIDRCFEDFSEVYLGVLTIGLMRVD